MVQLKYGAGREGAYSVWLRHTSEVLACEMCQFCIGTGDLLEALNSSDVTNTLVPL